MNDLLVLILWTQFHGVWLLFEFTHAFYFLVNSSGSMTPQWADYLNASTLFITNQ